MQKLWRRHLCFRERVLSELNHQFISSSCSLNSSPRAYRSLCTKGTTFGHDVGDLGSPALRLHRDVGRPLFNLRLHELMQCGSILVTHFSGQNEREVIGLL
jgi:hypothetical protein